MQAEKRKIERSNIFLIVKFRKLSEKQEYSLGITRNCTQEGFSFESQYNDYSPGEVLEFIINNLHSETSLSASGRIVWKTESWYSRIMGVRFIGMDVDATGKISELINADSGVTLDSSFSERETLQSEEKNRIKESTLYEGGYYYAAEHEPRQKNVESGRPAGHLEQEVSSLASRKDITIEKMLKLAQGADENKSFGTGNIIIPNHPPDKDNSREVNKIAEKGTADDAGKVRTSRKKKNRQYISFSVLLVIITACTFVIPFETLEVFLLERIPALIQESLDAPVKTLPVSGSENTGPDFAASREIIDTHSGQYVPAVGVNVQDEKAYYFSENPIFPGNANNGNGQARINAEDKTAAVPIIAQVDRITGKTGNSPHVVPDRSNVVPVVSERAGRAESQALTGVPVHISHVGSNIFFDQNMDSISQDQYSEIDRIAGTLAEHPVAKVRIVGHTDNEGPEAYNMYLSVRRAAYAKKMLIARGVAASRIKVSGSGHINPIASNATEAGRKKNRRIEIMVFPGGQISRNQF